MFFIVTFCPLAANPFTVGLKLTEHMKYYRCLIDINPNDLEYAFLVVNKVTRDAHFPAVAQVRRRLRHLKTEILVLAPTCTVRTLPLGQGEHARVRLV